jgi:antitoxin component of MazEF toxin-antitoxin module
MVKKLTKVGNSQAVIIPAQMIARFKLGRKIIIEETEDGILIRAIREETSFQKGMQKLRANKEAIYKRMTEQANDPKTKAYYANPENKLDDAGLDILDDY